jgi:hypothetical protein
LPFFGIGWEPPLPVSAHPGDLPDPLKRYAPLYQIAPGVSADRVERTVKGYRRTVARRLAQDWFNTYPDGFTFRRKSDDKEHRLPRPKMIVPTIIAPMTPLGASDSRL